MNAIGNPLLEIVMTRATLIPLLASLSLASVLTLVTASAAADDTVSRLQAAQQVMFEERDAICSGLVTEYTRRNGANGDQGANGTVEAAEAWSACRRQSPYGAIPRWRHEDELLWCRDEHATFAPIRQRLEDERNWLTREYSAITGNGASATRIEAYNERSRAYQALSARHMPELTRYTQRCTGYRTSPRITLSVCGGRSDGFCRN